MIEFKTTEFKTTNLKDSDHYVYVILQVQHHVLSKALALIWGNLVYNENIYALAGLAQ